MNRPSHLASQPTHGLSRISIILVLVFLLLIVLPLALVMINRPRAPAVTLPTPNGVDTLSEVSELMSGYMELLGEKSIEELDDVEAIRNFLAENSQAMELYNTALGQDCVPVVDYDKGFAAAIDDDMMTNYRTATYLPRAAARLAELEERPNDAARHYAGLFTLGSKFGSDGLLMHAQLAFAFQRLALLRLNELAGSMDQQTKTAVLQLIESAPHKTLDYDAIEERERVLLNNEHGAIQYAYLRFMTRNMPNDPLNMTKKVDAEIVAMQNELFAKLKP